MLNIHLIQYKFAKRMWKLTPFWAMLKENSTRDLSTLIRDAISLVQKTDTKLMCVIMWAIWNARNKNLFEKKK